MRSPAAKPGARGGLVGQHLVDQRRAEIAAKPERRHEIAFPVGAAQRRERHRAPQARAIGTLDVDRDVGARPTRAAGASAGPASCARARRRPRRRDRRRGCRPRPPACLAGGAASSARCAGNAGDERAGEEQHREQQVRDRSRGDDRDALPDALPVEGARQVRRRDGAFALVDHLHVAAERDRGDAPIRCGRGRSGATRRRVRSRRRSAAP